MPEVSVDIGGRAYVVACDPGQEDALRTAAALLGREAHTVNASAGMVPESRMLLMAGLMLADRMREQDIAMAELKDRIRAVEMRAERAEADAARTSDTTAQSGLFEAEDTQARALLERIALELETLADDLEGSD
ncbi:MAG: cell division protein ZapA [Rubricella sp.]